MRPPSSASPGGSPSGRTWQPPSLAALQGLLPAYEFLVLLGRGGMGAVFKATQRSLSRTVAIKVLPANLMEDTEANFSARFRQEALTMAKLTHPGIVGVFESGAAGGLLYIVMEFVEGTDVARMIASEGKLAPELATKLLTQVCDALHYAHERGVIHRDIKPANLLLTRDGTVKIADFGLAKHHDDALLGLTKTNVAIGTPDFLAPEAWIPGRSLDARADLYALGVTLYQMLTGEVPRGFWEMPSARVGTDARFDAIIERALQPKPEARYQSSAELRRDLDRIQAGASAMAPGRTVSASRLSRRAGMAIAAVAIFLLTGATLMTWLASARGVRVTTLADGGPGSLRQAVSDSRPGATITFAQDLSGGTLLLLSGQMVLTNDLTIDASALPGGLRIDGNHVDRIFEVISNVTVTLRSLTLTNGAREDVGGGILNLGYLTLHRCAVEGNTASTEAGGIHNKGWLTLRQCTISGNASHSGGGIMNTHGTLRISECTFVGNGAGIGGGGIGCSYGTLTVEQSTFARNRSSGSGRYMPGGGGISVHRAQVILNHCTVSENSAVNGGGIKLFESRLFVTNSIVAGNTASGSEDNLRVDASEITADGSLTNGAPMLSPLGDHGGPTLTMPPLPESPAIDAAVDSAFATDQRGFPRPIGAAPDLGAAEAGLTRLKVQPGANLTNLSTGARQGDYDHPSTAPRHQVASANPAEVRAAAEWLVKNSAHFRVATAREKFEVKSAAEIPQEDFDIVTLWFDRLGSPLAWPPEEQFQVLRAVTTLREVFVRLPGLTDEAFEFLAGNSNLTRLTIEASSLTDCGLAHIARLPNIKNLSVSGTHRVTGAGFVGATWLATVEHAHFLGTGLDDDGVRMLARCPRLTDVNIGKTPVTREGVRTLAAVPALTDLVAEDCRNLSDADFAEVLPGFKVLRVLNLAGTRAGDETAAAVGAMTNLVQVDFSTSRLTDAGLAQLASLPRLRRMGIHGTRVTQTGIAAFESARPDCQLTQ